MQYTTTQKVLKNQFRCFIRISKILLYAIHNYLNVLLCHSCISFQIRCKVTNNFTYLQIIFIISFVKLYFSCILFARVKKMYYLCAVIDIAV